MSTWREDLTLLRHRNFAVLLIARTVSVLGGAFAPVALAFGVLHLPGSDGGDLSLVLASEAVPLVLFMLIGGVIADRFPRNRVMMLGESTVTAAFGVLAVLLMGAQPPIWALSVAAAFTGIGLALTFPALTGIIPDVVPKDRLQTGNAILGLGQNVARVTGLVLSGIMVATIGAPWSLAIASAMFGFAALTLTLLRIPRHATPAEEHSVFADLREGWSEFVSHEWLWVVVVQFAFLVLVFQGAHGVLGPILADAELGGAKGWSWVLAGEAAGMIIGVVAAMRIKPRHPIRWSVLVLIPTVPLPYLLLGLSAPLWIVVVAAFAMGVAFDIFGVLWQTTMQREVPPEALSRVSSYDALGSLMFGPLGLLIAGPLAQGIGVHQALVWCAGALLLISVLPLASRSVRTITWRTHPVSGSDDDLPALPTPAEQLL